MNKLTKNNPLMNKLTKNNPLMNKLTKNNPLMNKLTKNNSLMNKLTKKPVKSDKVKCTDKSNYFTELVGCSNGECDVYTSMTISPTQKTLYSNKSFICGYYYAILLNTITNEHSISHQGKCMLHN
ncbi:hypothetical protein GJ496_000319 [Pomphorhynchus laevis]|nr:hypothetical protein GJ496_000319 [Pomphorhynchus laevis]